MTRLAERVRALHGWRRVALAVLLGLAGAFALPPFHIVPLLVPALIGFLWLIEGSRNWRGAIAIGWLFGLGHFGFAFYWVANSLLVEAERFGWMYPIIWFAMGGGFACYLAGVALLQHLTRARGLAAILFFAVLWTAGERLRGYLFTGFPWNLIGSVWGFDPLFMQSAALWGLYGLSAVTVLAATLPAWTGSRATWRGSAAALAIVLGLVVLGLVRVPSEPAPTQPGIVMRLVQPAISQAEKWAPGGRERTFQRTIELSRGPGWERVTHVVWPETAIPFLIQGDAARSAMLAAIVPRGGVLVTGAPRAERDGSGVRIWNSLFAFDPNGAIVATYDKFHLVPWGEYVPLRSLDWFRLTEGMGDFASGPGPTTLRVPGLPPFSPLICYEVIFPGNVTARGERPAFLLNVTNDAWFGRSPGPYQHLVSARFRAVEEGLPLVRAANNGISALIDPHGRMLGTLGLDAAGAVDAPLPLPLAPTLFAQWGELSALLLCGLMLCAALLIWGGAIPRYFAAPIHSISR